MNYDRECSFDEFKEKLLEFNKKFRGNNKSSEEILEDVKNILDFVSKEDAQ